MSSMSNMNLVSPPSYGFGQPKPELDSPQLLSAQAAEDFFTPFLNPDFPIDLSLPMQLNPTDSEGARVQPQAPLMQVAQSQRRNPKLVGKRKLQAVNPRRARGGKQDQVEEEEEPLGEDDLLGGASQGGDGEKRQKRLVKNRQAAQLFRKRQKQYISDLEGKVADVSNKNVALTARVDVLHAENKLLKDQLTYLRTFVVSALQQAFPPDKWKNMQHQLGDIGYDKDEASPAVGGEAAFLPLMSPTDDNNQL